TEKGTAAQTVKNITVNFRLRFNSLAISRILWTKVTKKIQRKAHNITFVYFVKKLRVLCGKN
ncbi:MAG: hypothetical protein ACKOU7_08455, partial [Ferruginibacter sp.]